MTMGKITNLYKAEKQQEQRNKKDRLGKALDSFCKLNEAIDVIFIIVYNFTKLWEGFLRVQKNEFDRNDFMTNNRRGQNPRPRYWLSHKTFSAVARY